jgi:hypothetical protein
MMRRLTIACGLLTVAVAVVLAWQPGQTLFGARSSHRGATPVTVIPDAPARAFWPPVKPTPPDPPPLKGLPPAPRPQPLHHTTAPAPAQPASPAPRPAVAVRSTVAQIVGIVHTLFNLPKVLDQTQVNPGH